jgi:hypothetical protein
VVEGVDGGYLQGWYVKLFDNGNEWVRLDGAHYVSRRIKNES